MPRAKADSAAATLLAALCRRIRRDGPMPVDRFMQACLDDPVHGYRLKPQTIGADGDFVTAPEISQVFGELIGLWCAVVWAGMGRPAPVRLVELGPGRGTMLRDALRAAKAVPQFLAAATLHLVETSAALREMQHHTLQPGSRGADQIPRVAWHERLAEVPAGAAVIVANEFLDALPIRQLLSRDGAWCERVVEATPDGDLRFAAGPKIGRPDEAPPPDGAIWELRAGEDELLAALAARSAPHVALFVDYGPAGPAFGDTLQAVRRHAYVDPLAEPGTADLTAHVQFSVLAGKARTAGLAVDGPISQGEFLGRLGSAERTARLMAANPVRAAAIEAATQRLMSPTGMGQLFKAMVVRSPELPSPPPFG